MTELLSYWIPLTVLLAIAKRWTDLDPLSIENGPRWPRAFVKAGKSTLLLKLGFVMFAAGQPTSSFHTSPRQVLARASGPHFAPLPKTETGTRARFLRGTRAGGMMSLTAGLR
ncbi:hypothetical protein [Mesorhizobium sp. M0496]|uniref:hypothetical protein n=1 Tax=Mesorhizobium sp. M0496 TaxID=2956952 RepID=UPI003335341A